LNKLNFIIIISILSIFTLLFNILISYITLSQLSTNNNEINIKLSKLNNLITIKMKNIHENKISDINKTYFNHTIIEKNNVIEKYENIIKNQKSLINKYQSEISFAKSIIDENWKSSHLKVEKNNILHKNTKLLKNNNITKKQNYNENINHSTINNIRKNNKQNNNKFPSNNFHFIGTMKSEKNKGKLSAMVYGKNPNKLQILEQGKYIYNIWKVVEIEDNKLILQNSISKTFHIVHKFKQNKKLMKINKNLMKINKN
jgi:Tfp pilus assembly protein PilP